MFFFPIGGIQKKVTLGLLEVLDTSLTVSMSGSLISGFLEMEKNSEKVTVKLLQGKIYANMSTASFN